MALRRLVKWPVYVLHGDTENTDYKVFELVRTLENEALMRKELKSAEYENLMGAVKVLGKMKESHLYDTIENTNLLQEKP